MKISLYILPIVITFATFLSPQSRPELIKSASYYIIHTPRYCMRYKGNVSFRLCLKPCESFNSEREKNCRFCNHNELRDRTIRHYLQEGYIVVTYYNYNNAIVSLEAIRGINPPPYGINERVHYHEAAEKSFQLAQNQLKPHEQLDPSCRPRAFYAQISSNTKYKCPFKVYNEQNELLCCIARYPGTKGLIPPSVIRELEQHVDLSTMQYIEDKSCRGSVFFAYIELLQEVFPSLPRVHRKPIIYPYTSYT